MEDLKFSVLMPTYNGSKWVKQAINSVLRQSLTNFEIIICDDCSTDNTIDTIKDIQDNRIKIFKNDINLGYPPNLEKARLLSSKDSDIVYLMAQDDILAKDALLKTYQAFKISEEIGVVGRAYYQFDGNDFNHGIRHSAIPMSNKPFDIINIYDENRICHLMSSLGQLSGLAYRKSYIDIPFQKDVFVSHIYPFLSIIKKYKAVYLNDYIVAVRTEGSQCIHVSSIYEVSPLKSWVDMFNNIFNDKKYDNLRKLLINDSSKKIEGILQIKNFGKTKYYLREIMIYVKYRPKNLLSVKFWTYVLGSLTIPKRLLIKLISWYKNNILAKEMLNVRIQY